MATPKGLGKGLGAIFGEIPQQVTGKETITTLPLTKLEPNPDQPRKVFEPEALDALADSIRTHGIIQPIAVAKGENGFYQIIAGERRWRAARLAGLTQAPVLVLEADTEKTMELALVENLQRMDLNPVEESLGYRRLMEEFGATQEQVAEKVGKSRPAVANSLRLLALPGPILDMVSTGKISAGHGRAVLTLKTEKEQLAAAQKIAALALSVRQAELMCKSMAKEIVQPAPCQDIKVDYLAECEKSLSRTLGRGVKITSGKRKGKLDLEFYGPEDLQNLLDALESIQYREATGK